MPSQDRLNHQNQYSLNRRNFASKAIVIDVAGMSFILLLDDSEHPQHFPILDVLDGL